jgi:hypothetical protein
MEAPMVANLYHQWMLRLQSFLAARPHADRPARPARR